MKNKGFTLVELLAVIVIMGVLLLVAVPSIKKLQDTVDKKTFEEDKKLFKQLVLQRINSDSSLTIDNNTYFCLSSEKTIVPSNDCINIKGKSQLNGDYKDGSYIYVRDSNCIYSNNEYNCSIEDSDIKLEVADE